MAPSFILWILGPLAIYYIFSLLVGSSDASAIAEKLRQEILTALTASTEIPNSAIIPTRTLTSGFATTIARLTAEAKADPDCISWDKVTLNDVGKWLCVYGKIDDVLDDYWTSGDYWGDNYQYGYSQYIYFSQNHDRYSTFFRIVIEDRGFSQLEVGRCLIVEGLVEKYGNAGYTFIEPTAESHTIEYSNTACK